MFRIVKYLNYVHQDYFEKMAVEVSASELLKAKGINTESKAPVDLLLLLQVNGKKLLVIFPCYPAVFLGSENNIKIFIRFFHMILFPCKFFEVMIIGLQFMKFLSVILNTFDIILPVCFEFMQVLSSLCIRQ